MKIETLTIAVLMTGSLMHGELKPIVAERTVTACVTGNDLRLLPGSVERAQMLASRIFDDVGVTIKWKKGLRDCPAHGILIDMSFHTPDDLRPGALAYALPLEGTHIRVFYDRISGSRDKWQVGTVLGHVFVHEITHILQVVPRHSATGIMKAWWTPSDFAAMAGQALRFEDEDIAWIERGMAWRAGRHAAVNVDATVAGQ